MKKGADNEPKRDSATDKGDSFPGPCPDCNGTGEGEVETQYGSGYGDVLHIIHECNGCGGSCTVAVPGES